MAEEAIVEVAHLLRRRNQIDERIASLIGRPMTAGHLGEWIASQVFDIQLEASAVTAALDGRFRSGPLAGRSVNVKWYLKAGGLVGRLHRCRRRLLRGVGRAEGPSGVLTRVDPAVAN